MNSGVAYDGYLTNCPVSGSNAPDDAAPGTITDGAFSVSYVPQVWHPFRRNRIPLMTQPEPLRCPSTGMLTTISRPAIKWHKLPRFYMRIFAHSPTPIAQNLVLQ